MFTTIKSAAVVLSIALFATGCAATANENSSESDSDLAVTPGQTLATLESGTFNLYSTPNASAPLACGLYTQLTFTNDGNGTHAEIKDLAQGPCGMYVYPNVRDLDLKVASFACGAITFQGEATVQGKLHKITITDSRKSNCADKAEASIIVDDVVVNGPVVTRFSAN